MKIQTKLFAAFIVFGTLLVLSLVALMQWSLGKGMVEYVNQKEVDALKPFIQQLTEHYRVQGSWQAYDRAHRTFERQISQALQGSDFSVAPPSAKRRRPPREQHLPSRPLAKPHGLEQRPPKPHIKQPPVSYALLDQNKQYIVGHYPQERNYRYLPLLVNEKLVGYFAISKRDRLTQGYEFDFVEQQKGTLWLLAIAVLGLVLLIILPFANHLIAPIKQLANGMHLLTQGKYRSELSTHRRDEFADLTRDFNELAKTLLANDTARKRWLANISHELRTPVAILKGELEAVLDGVRELSIEQIQSAHQEVGHLQRLIEDLHALTSADIGGMSYQKTSLNLGLLLEREANKLQSYLQSKGFDFEYLTSITQAKVQIFADQTRLSQLFENLANNCVKYNQTGNKVRLSATLVQNEVQLVIEDDGVGVETQHLAHLFEHLYRVETSRNRKTGGSGLGLSICAHIVKAHQGTISAEKSGLGGLAIHISLPLAS